jgi:hypothetical protein
MSVRRPFSRFFFSLSFPLAAFAAIAPLSACSGQPSGSASATGPLPATALERTALAQSALARVSHVVSTHGASIGLGSASELARAQVARETPVFRLSLDDIAAYDRKRSTHDLLGESREMLYTVKVDGAPSSGISLARNTSGQWDVVGVGRANLVRSLERGILLESARHDVSQVSLIILPADPVGMLAFEEGGRLVVVPLADVAGTKLLAHHPSLFEDALAELAPRARAQASRRDEDARTFGRH